MKAYCKKCERCHENGLRKNQTCEYYGEPNGCNHPKYGFEEGAEPISIKAWMARTERGAFLCWGDKNNGRTPLTMHLGFPVEAEAFEYERFIYRTRKFEIKSDIETWHAECLKKWGKLTPSSRCHAVKVRVTWEEV